MRKKKKKKKDYKGYSVKSANIKVLPYFSKKIRQKKARPLSLHVSSFNLENQKKKSSRKKIKIIQINGLETSVSKSESCTSSMAFHGDTREQKKARQHEKV